jgi:hypothetical protein
MMLSSMKRVDTNVVVCITWRMGVSHSMCKRSSRRTFLKTLQKLSSSRDAEVNVLHTRLQ